MQETFIYAAYILGMLLVCLTILIIRMCVTLNGILEHIRSLDLHIPVYGIATKKAMEQLRKAIEGFPKK